MNRLYFSNNITSLEDNEIFVFGSNEAGIHGSGAARVAKDIFKAKYGIGVGFTGQCYALPTKDMYIQTLPLNKIQFYCNNFLFDARKFKDKTFFVTQVGCGLAGYHPRDIAPFFKNAPKNCVFDIEWEPYLRC